ncbi:MAG: LysR family transcriptional regulator [Sphaerochaeta sp.]|jgi:DNA-binding transcriptional LysR family regulator|nr:LysR family transcriptional regulator [Spirochaetales bacterium]
MLDVKIKTFMSLVETESFTKTAELLYITQPAVSHQIRLLEKEYGIKIFLRSGRNLKLTAEGEILYKYAQRAVAIEEAASHALQDSRHNIRRLNIGLTATAEENLLPQVIAEYCNLHGKTKVRIETGTLESLRTSLQSYEIDMAIVGGHIADDEFTTVKIDTDYLNLVVSPKNPLAKSSLVTLEELKQERLILRPNITATRQQFEYFLTQNGETITNYNVVIEINNVPIIKDLVHDNQGVTIMSHNACLVDQLAGKLVTVPLEGSVRMVRELNIVYRNNYRHPEVASEIRRIYHIVKEKSFPQEEQTALA